MKELYSPICQLRKLAYALIHSPTVLLPAWHAVLKQLDLAMRNMPRDVRTRWNSTYTMLVFAIDYKSAIKNITGDIDLDLRNFELTSEEWEIVEQLRDVLKVSTLL